MRRRKLFEKMKRDLFPPGRLLIAAVLYALVTVVAMLLFAIERPWMGLSLSFDKEQDAAIVRRSEGPAKSIPVGTALTTVSGRGGESLRLIERDFTLEPDGIMETYDAYEVFLQRQGRLSALQASPEVTWTDKDGRSWTLKPESSRPIGSLPPEFWVQIAVGVIAWLIASGVWAFRPGEPSARYLLLSGWSTIVFAPLPAVYSTRELGLQTELFRWLSDLNFMGGSLFVGTLVALLCCYPRRIAPAWVCLAVVLVQFGWFVAQQVGMMESMVFTRRILVMVYVGLTFVLAAVQWRGTRRDPVGRAALRWFLLSWLVGSSVFCLLILLPQMFGVDTSAVQGYAFLLFVLVYVGLAFGILRFRLFGLDEWWVRIVTWLGALAFLVVLDLVFLWRLGLSTGTSLSLALIICGLLWLPLRGYLSARFLSQPVRNRQNAFKAVVDVALAPRPEDRDSRWRQCLREGFDPLHIEPAETANTEPSIEEAGLAMVFPAAADVGAVRLRYARAGRGLFTVRDLAAAVELTGMLRHVIESRRAYEQGVLVERGRIARDIHDNIGAQLLSALHSREADRREEVLRGALSDLRGIINDAANPGLAVDEALGDLRYETAGRLSASGVELDWQVLDEVSGASLPAKVLHALRPLIREAMSNILKHAQARTVRVRIRRDAESLAVSIEDDGLGFDAAKVRAGNGLANMRARTQSVNGGIEWAAAEGGRGTRVLFSIPLKSASA